MVTVLLGTVAIEPNRWGTIDRSRRATVDVAPWLASIAEAGFDGIELWDGHLDDEVLAGPLPVTVFNSYVSFDDDDSARRADVAADVARTGCRAVKFNVGRSAGQEQAYARRVGEWRAQLPEAVALLCECHAGTIAEDPAVAARVLAAAGPPERVGAIVHTHEETAQLQARFEAYGERIAHVHVNFLDGGRAPRLADVRPELEEKLALLRSLGFTGSWTIEFVAGVLTDRDHPEHLVAQAADDLAVLREVLG